MKVTQLLFLVQACRVLLVETEQRPEGAKVCRLVKPHCVARKSGGGRRPGQGWGSSPFGFRDDSSLLRKDVISSILGTSFGERESARALSGFCQSIIRIELAFEFGALSSVSAYLVHFVYEVEDAALSFSRRVRPRRVAAVQGPVGQLSRGHALSKFEVF